VSRAILVLYHDNCPDGFTAAWAVWRAVGEFAEYRGVNYGQPPVTSEDVAGRNVVLVDFTYPRAVLDEIAKHAATVRILDHHKTAQADLEGWNGGHVTFDMDRSGAGIAWDYYHVDVPGGGPRPRLVDYVEDRDLWRWKLPHSREVSEFMFAMPRTFEAWDFAARELEDNFDNVVSSGRILLQVKQERVKAMCKHVRWMKFGEHAIPVVNASWDFSEIGEYLAEQYNGVGGYYLDRSDRRQWGFRSCNGLDVSAICKQFGGGGHAAAAGFTTAIGWEPAVVMTTIATSGDTVAA
jgi:oligoribonuclease NrnB/cAMP/cGMP phosphodiesterase (DHH superfamily)